MKYLLVRIADYKGGEISGVEIHKSILNCILSAIEVESSYETAIEIKEFLIEAMQNDKSLYAGGASYCFKIYAMQGDQLIEVSDVVMNEIIRTLTLEQVNEYYI